jgi:hypothetical protein
MEVFGRLILLAMFLGTSGPVAAQCTTATAGDSPFSISISAAEQQVVSGSPVKVKLTLTNKSDHDISIWRENTEDEGGRTYRVDVHDDANKVPPETKIGTVRNGNWAELSRLSPEEIDLGGSGACITLKSGKSLTEDVSISRLYDLGKPGKYTIQLRRLVEGIGTYVKSNTVTVTVTP